MAKTVRNKIRTSTSRKVFCVFNYTFLTLLGLVCALPMWHVVCASLSDPMALTIHKGLILWPLSPATDQGYVLTFGNKSILSGFVNTLFYVGVGTLINTVLTIMGGYVLSRKTFLWRNVAMIIISFTMLFNGGMIPTYIVVTQLGLYDSRWSLILPTAISVFNLIIMRTSMQEIPDSLEESAKLDGAGHWRIMWSILLPVSKATVAVITLFYAVGNWNAWFNAMLYLQDRSKYPLQLIMREIVMQNTQGTSSALSTLTDVYRPLVKYAVIVISTLPILLVYPFAQKYFVKGVMIGSIKG